MKVLQINSFFTVGGPPRIMNGIYDTLKENGYDCKIAAAREKMYAPEDSFQIGKKEDVYINAFSCRLFDNEGFRSKKATKELIRKIEEYDPDIIHLHNLHGYYINIELLFKYLKQCKKRIYWTLHDCWSFTGHCSYFTIVKCEQWKTHCSYCVQSRRYPSCYLKGHANKNFARKKTAFTKVPNMTIVTPSQWLADLVKQSFLREYPVEVINNGIDLTKFSPIKSDFKQKYGLSEKKVILGVAQVWGERKGLFDYYKLAGMLDDNYQVVLVGLNEKQKANLPGNIMGFTKTNSIEELVDMYSAADVFVNLTYEDNFPTVNIEALACGTPIITYRTGGSPEIADPENEVVCEQGDLIAVKNAVESLDGKMKNIERLTANASRYSRQNMTNAYIDLYTNAIKRGGVITPDFLLLFDVCKHTESFSEEVWAA